MVHRYAKIDPETMAVLDEWEQEEPLESYVDRAKGLESGKAFVVPVRVGEQPEHDPAKEALTPVLELTEAGLVRRFEVAALSKAEIARREEADAKMILRDRLVDILLEKGVISLDDAK